MAADGCISAHHQKMREQLGEKMGGCARGSGREGTMAWKVRDTGGAWWDVKEETTVWWWVRRQVMDETEVRWGGELKEREDEGEQLCCSWHLHRKHLGKLSIRQACLIDFLLFSISISLRVPLSLQNVPWCQLPVVFFFPFIHSLCCMSGPNSHCHIDCPKTASNQHIRRGIKNMLMSPLYKCPVEMKATIFT